MFAIATNCTEKKGPLLIGRNWRTMHYITDFVSNLEKNRDLFGCFFFNTDKILVKGIIILKHKWLMLIGCFLMFILCLALCKNLLKEVKKQHII